MGPSVIVISFGEYAGRRQAHLTRLETSMLRLSQGVEMADEITKYGFTPGPITKKELEPAPEPTPEPKPVPAVIVQQHPTTVQVVQQYPNAEKIILMLGHHSACCRDYVAEHGTVPGWCRVAIGELTFRELFSCSHFAAALLTKAALISDNLKSLETRSRFYQSDIFQWSQCLKNFIPGELASCSDDHFRQTEVFSEIFEIQTVGLVFECREETNFLFVGPVRKLQTIIDVIDLSAVHVRNLKTKADSAMFITVMRPNNRVAPVRTKAKHAVRSGASCPCVIQCHPFRFVRHSERQQFKRIVQILYC